MSITEDGLKQLHSLLLALKQKGYILSIANCWLFSLCPTHSHKMPRPRGSMNASALGPPLSDKERLGSSVAIEISASSKGFGLPFFTPPYPMALSVLSTPPPFSQPGSQPLGGCVRRLARGPFQQQSHRHSVTVWKAALSHPPQANLEAKRTVAPHRVPFCSDRLLPAPECREPFSLHPLAGLEPFYPSPGQAYHSSPPFQAHWTFTTSQHFP